MTAIRKQTFILLLLPLLALRTLVPVGYMVDTSGGRLSIVMCGGDGPLTIAALTEYGGQATNHSEMDHGQMDHAQHTGHAGHHGSEHDKHKNSICPFAAAGSAATLASVPSLPVGIEPVRIVAVSHDVAIQGLSGPSRAQQSRGPPHFS
jgi:hypothetical protein